MWRRDDLTDSIEISEIKHVKRIESRSLTEGDWMLAFEERANRRGSALMTVHNDDWTVMRGIRGRGLR